ncbi:hypothetical protein [Okeania sp. KiyG1]|uniref:hypothetical protein n=1 Tax=Okeania sp. KiyG1 TaxID=2720165 RepID=UPI0019226917|nr:hypothetical protein [Okeania sp. KiyG1]
MNIKFFLLSPFSLLLLLNPVTYVAKSTVEKNRQIVLPYKLIEYDLEISHDSQCNYSYGPVVENLLNILDD